MLDQLIAVIGAVMADRARRMAFISQHGLMNPRIEASLNRLVRGAGVTRRFL